MGVHRDLGSRRSIIGKSPTTAKWKTKTVIAKTGRPAPQAIPTADVNQTVAAVVRPRTKSLRTKMTPPPMKPMPETT